MLIQTVPKKENRDAEIVCFLCTLEGRVRKFFRVKDLTGLVVMEVEESSGLFGKNKATVLQVLFKHATEPEVLVNLINHRLNGAQNMHHIISVVNHFWKIENKTANDLPMEDFRNDAKVSFKDLRGWMKTRRTDVTVEQRAREYLGKSTSGDSQGSKNLGTSMGNSMEHTAGHEDMDVTYGGDRLDAFIVSGVVPQKKARDQGDLGLDAPNTAEEDELEAALRGLAVVE